MLDKLSLALLNILNNECTGSGYKVFSLAEIALSFPSHFQIDEDGIRESLNNLATREYVSVKYEDEKEFCAMPTSKGRLVFENRMDQEIEQSRTAKRFLLYSFFGALSGGLLAALVAAILVLIIGSVR